MRCNRVFMAFALLVVLGLSIGPQAATADGIDNAFSGTIQLVNGLFVSSMQDPVTPVQPVQPEQPVQPVGPQDAPAISDTGTVWGGGISLVDLPTELAVSQVGGVAQGEESAYLGSTDVGNLLEESGGTNNVFLFTRSPISNEPRVRGYRYAQIRNTVNGAAFFPMRPDLDTPLSRIDSSIIDEVLIVDGPYNVRLGPGFTFVDVRLKDTPRSRCGTFGGRTALGYDVNGAGIYGNQMFEGGGADYGWRIGYVHRTGADYFDGNGNRIAASHNVRNWDLGFGYDLSPCDSLEVTYLRNDLTGIDMPSQINDLRSLTSDSFLARYISEYKQYYDRLAVTAWYNNGFFEGIPAADSKDGVIAALGINWLTRGWNRTGGLRMAMSWGDARRGQVTLGTDFTHVKQRYTELDVIPGNVPPESYFGLSPAEQNDLGLFADATLPLNHRLTLKAGGRIDWVGSASAGRDILPDASFTPNPIGGEFQDFTLGAGYLTAEYTLNRELTATAGFGMAQRAPTPSDLFLADAPYLSILQQGGLMWFRGNPNLAKETSQQVDVGLRAEYSDFQGGIRGFYSRIDDFITYTNLGADPSFPGYGAFTVNRDATLSGFELYGDYELNRRLTPFGSLVYVEGRDEILNEPLWGVPPLQGVVGLRLNDRRGGQRWGLEYRARIVADQNRLSSVGIQATGVVGELPTQGFVTHDVRGYYRLNQALTFIAGVENLGDAFYLEHLDSRLNLNSLALNGVYRRGSNAYFMIQAEY